MSEVEAKGLADALIAKFKSIMSRVLSREYVGTITRRSYNKGLEDFEERVHPLRNVVPNDDAINFLSDYTFELIKGVNDDTVKKLRNELVSGLMQREGAVKIAERVRTVMDVSKARAATIARTETHRAYSAGEMFAGRQSGLDLMKEVFNPTPESDICKALSKRKPIGMNEKWSFGGKEYDVTPFHPNCTSTTVLTQREASS